MSDQAINSLLEKQIKKLKRDNDQLREALRKIRDQSGASLRIRREGGIAINEDEYIHAGSDTPSARIARTVLENTE